MYILELPVEVVEFLRENFPETEDVVESRNLYFLSIALSFGLGPYSPTWSRPSRQRGGDTRCVVIQFVSPRIDDFLPMSPWARTALVLSIQLVYEFTHRGGSHLEHRDMHTDSHRPPESGT